MLSDGDWVIHPAGRKGDGLFATRAIPEGELLFVVDMTRLTRRRREEIDADKTVDGDHSHYVGRGRYVVETHPACYMNHSCEPSCRMRHLSLSRYEIIAQRDIPKGDELTHDYGAASIDQLEGLFLWEEPCLCGSPRCRGIIHGDFFRMPEEWQMAHWLDLPPSVRRKHRKRSPFMPRSD